jgi:transcriptional regulator of acetoin/glycerol metabolism
VCHSGLIERAHLPVNLCSVPSPDFQESTHLNTLDQVEASFLMNALRRNNWSRIETARQLGIHKTTLFRKMKSLGLQAPRAKVVRQAGNAGA